MKINEKPEEKTMSIELSQAIKEFHQKLEQLKDYL